MLDEDAIFDKEFARDLAEKAEIFSEDSDDFEYLADFVGDEDYLGDKEWARKLRSKA